MRCEESGLPIPYLEPQIRALHYSFTSRPLRLSEMNPFSLAEHAKDAKRKKGRGETNQKPCLTRGRRAHREKIYDVGYLEVFWGLALREKGGSLKDRCG
jgi:hypothetical protein